MTSEHILDVRKIVMATGGKDKRNRFYMMVLPMEWVREEKLEKGGRLIVKKDDHRIILEKLDQ